MFWDDDPSINGAADAVSAAASFALPGMGSVLGLIGGLGSSLLSRNSAKSANDQNRLTALYQMQWQERMANTAHQREVDDLRAAGLNPILSVSKGGPGAATPQGAGYTAQPVYRAEGQAALSNAMVNSAKTGAELELLFSEAAKNKAETIVADRTADEITARTPVHAANIQEIGSRISLNKVSEHELQERAFRYGVQNALTYSEQSLVEQKIKNAVAEHGHIVALTGNVKVDTVLKQLTQPEHQAGSAYWKEVGKGGMYWREGSKAVGAATGGALGGLLGNALRRGIGRK